MCLIMIAQSTVFLATELKVVLKCFIKEDFVLMILTRSLMGTV